MLHGSGAYAQLSVSEVRNGLHICSETFFFKSRNPLYRPHNNSSVHLMKTAFFRLSGRITDGRRSGWTTLRDSVLSLPTPAPTLLEWPFREQRGFGLITSALCRTFPLLLAQMGYGLLCGLCVWRRKTNRRPCCPPVCNPSTSKSQHLCPNLNTCPTSSAA